MMIHSHEILMYLICARSWNEWPAHLRQTSASCSWRQDAVGLLRSMPCAKFHPSIYSYNASISACGWADAYMALPGNLRLVDMVTSNFMKSVFSLPSFRIFFDRQSSWCAQRWTRAWRFSATHCPKMGRSGLVAMGCADLPTASAGRPAAGVIELHGTAGHQGHQHSMGISGSSWRQWMMKIGLLPWLLGSFPSFSQEKISVFSAGTDHTKVSTAQWVRWKNPMNGKRHCTSLKSCLTFAGLEWFQGSLCVLRATTWYFDVLCFTCFYQTTVLETSPSAEWHPTSLPEWFRAKQNNSSAPRNVFFAKKSSLTWVCGRYPCTQPDFEAWVTYHSGQTEMLPLILYLKSWQKRCHHKKAAPVKEKWS